MKPLHSCRQHAAVLYTSACAAWHAISAVCPNSTYPLLCSSSLFEQRSQLQVMDFSALGAQAVAQVERAQRAAREQLIAAMNQRPKLSLKLELEGPKIAIPVHATDSQGEAPKVPHPNTSRICQGMYIIWTWRLACATIDCTPGP